MSIFSTWPCISQQHVSSVTRPRHAWWIAAGLCFVCSTPAFAQQAAPAGADQAPGNMPAPAPIATAEIASEAISTNTLLQGASDELATNEDIQYIEDRYTATSTRLDTLQKKTRQRLRVGGPGTVLEETKREWLRAEVRLSAWLETLTSRADDIDSLMDGLHNEKSRWELTRDAADADLPPELKTTIGETLDAITGVEQQLRSVRNTVLSLQARIGRQRTRGDVVLTDLRNEIAERRQRLLRIDSPPLWKAFGAVEGQDKMSTQFATILQKGTVVREYLAQTGPTLLWRIFLFFLLVTGIMVLGHKARAASEQDSSLQLTVSLLERPFAAALVIFLPLVMVTDAGAPSLWSGILGLVIIVAGLRLVPQLLHSSKHSWAYLWASLLLAWQLVWVTPAGSSLHRMMLLILSVLGVFVCIRLARAVDSGLPGGSKNWLRAYKIGCQIAGVLLVVGVIANVVGSLGLATFVTDGTLYAVFGAFLLSMAVLVLQGLVRIGLLTRTAHRLHLERAEAERIRLTLFRLLKWLAIVAWFYIVLSSFLIFDPVISLMRSALEFNISIGELALSPADILIFFLVIWLSFKLSQFIRFVLDTDVLPRMHLPRGAPAAITSLTHYTIIVIGVLIAFAAAGLDMGRITIIFGALSVGIGFGLQNVVNNFVSGLILLFERPIKLGDVVQIGGNLGVVKHIALRASNVRTYDGAMIIVPNSDLISAEVVNWSYFNDRRRTEIPVSVAYGTDPGKVIELLLEVASNHQEVSETPPPGAFFIEFGDSSLDFFLRIWTPTEPRIRITSELRVGIAQALAEAGIEIPFPQRDLHLRSSAVELSKTEDST